MKYCVETQDKCLPDVQSNILSLKLIQWEKFSIRGEIYSYYLFMELIAIKKKFQSQSSCLKISFTYSIYSILYTINIHQNIISTLLAFLKLIIYMWPFLYCLDVYCKFVDVSTNALVLFKTINNNYIIKIIKHKKCFHILERYMCLNC